MTRKRLAIAAAAATLIVAGAISALVIGPQAVDMCVRHYENDAGGGDTMVVCNLPSSLKVPDLRTHTEGLVNGCARAINQSSSWSDCISSGKVSAMPANYSVHWYANINYGSEIACWQADGTSGILDMSQPGVNDTISSFRVLGGNC